MYKFFWLYILTILLSGEVMVAQTTPYLVILGTAQDAGYPQAACQKECCQFHWAGEQARLSPACLGLVDPVSQKKWLFEATPDIKWQLQNWSQIHQQKALLPNGIFLTHAHIGHYSGLMQLGREVIGSKDVPVFALPWMRTFLNQNGPWSQLVKLENIQLKPIAFEQPVFLSDSIKVTAIQVPHRDEFSETAGFWIQGPSKSALFIPDIDKWVLWDYKIEEWLAKVDYAFLDGTFFENGELPNRDMSEIPHPFMEETMNQLSKLPIDQKKKVHFIHFNHTNPVIWQEAARKKVLEAGFQIAREGQIIEL